MVVVDFIIVQVALPSIGKEFGITVNGLQWIVISYGLTLAGILMLSRRLGDVSVCYLFSVPDILITRAN